MAFASFSTPSLLPEEGGVVTISLENREKEKIPCNKRTTKYTTNLFWDGSQQSQSGCEVTSCKSVWLIANFELWIKICRISMWLLKITKSQNEFINTLLLPKYEQKIVRISALCTVPHWTAGQKSLQFLVHIFGETMTSWIHSKIYCTSIWRIYIQLLKFQTTYVIFGLCKIRIIQNLLHKEYRSFKTKLTYKTAMAVRVVEFSNGVYKIRKIFA